MTRFLKQVILAALLLPAMVAANCTTESLTQDLMTLVESSIVSSARQGREVDSLQINDQRIVCLSTGTIRGTYSSASVLVDIICNGSACPSSGVKQQQQFDFMCDSSRWFSPTGNVNNPEGANFSTPLRTDCGLCTRLTPASIQYHRYSNATHCIDCSPSCNTGLMECFGIEDEDCCTAIVNDSCTSNCTAPERPLPSNNYTCTVFCDSLAFPLNGNIDQSNGNFVDSVATYSCGLNHELQGSANRTCVVTGKSTAWTGTAPSCIASTTEMPVETVVCEILNAGSNQFISYSENCSVELGCQALYSCAKGYDLKEGATVRTCSLPKSGIPVWTGIAPKCEEQNNSLSRAELAGIGIGAAVLASVLIIGTTLIVIIILSKQN